MAKQNADLHWDLGHVVHKSRAINFFKLVSSAFCVYSPSVRKLYSNYEVVLPNDFERGLVVLPDPYNFHDTFNEINAEAVRKTGIRLIPGDCLGRKGLYLALPMKKDGAVKHRLVPLDEAISLLDRLYLKQTGAPFLPILLKGDLREFRASTPYLHLHSLVPQKLNELSSFQQADISQTIVERFARIRDLVVD